MKKFLPIFLLSISLFLNGCVSLRNFEKENSLFPNLSAVLDDGYQAALYRAKIDMRDKHFSGLFYFKTLADSSYRIIFMSEIGLNFLDLEYKNNSFKVINCQEFLNKQIIINTLKNDIKLLIDLPKNISKKYIYKNTNDQTILIKVKDNSKKYYYFCTPKMKVYRIVQISGFKHVEILIPEYNNDIPQKVEINHKRIKLSIKLNLLKLK